MEPWKIPFDTTLKLVEALTEGAMKMHETQLESATDAHANAEATRQSIASAGDPAAIMQLYAQWAQHNGAHAVAYWRALFDASLETHAALLKCLGAAGTPGAAIAPLDFDSSKNALLGAVDSAYKQWLETTRRLAGVHAE
jgi:phasin family protein